MRLRSFAALLPLLAVLSCSQYEPFDSAAHVRETYAERLPADLADQVHPPYELDDGLVAQVDSLIGPSGSERARSERVVDYVFGRLGLRYSLVPTRNAVETYRSRQGNCLSFVNLFVGIGRHVRLNPFYVEVKDYQRWNYKDGVVLSRGHIVAGLNLDGELSTFDFLPYRPKAYRDFAPIDDAMATAHYYNNLGAEALMRGDVAAARELLTIALGIAPDFEKALNNMGVVHLRTGESTQALELYEWALAFHADSVPILNNLVRAHQQLGNQDQAALLLTRLGDVNQTNPFFYIYQGEVAIAAGRLDDALRHMRKALRTDSEVPEVHLGLARVFLARGELPRARHHVERALKLDATHVEARKMAAMLSPPNLDGP